MSDSEGLFILGSSRSGTTLMHNIVQQIPRYAIYQAEPMLLYECHVKYRDLSNSKHRQAFLNDWFNSRQFARSGLSQNEFEELLQPKKISFPRLLSDFMGLIAQKQGYSNWIDSTPDNVFAIRDIIRYFPRAKIIHMVRDGRAVASSLSKLNWAGVDSDDMNVRLMYAALKWKQAVKAVHPWRSALGQRFLEVKYEDLASQPESTLEKVLGFLGHGDKLADIDLGNLNARSNVEYSANSAFKDVGKGISSEAIFRWRKVLSKEQIVLLEKCIGETLTTYDYALDTKGSKSLSEGIQIASKELYLNAKRMIKESTFVGSHAAVPLEIGKD